MAENTAQDFDESMKALEGESTPETIPGDAPEVDELGSDEPEVDEVSLRIQALETQLAQAQKEAKRQANDAVAMRNRVAPLQSQVSRFLKQQQKEQPKPKEHVPLSKRLANLPNWAEHASTYEKEGQAIAEAFAEIDNDVSLRYKTLEEKQTLIDKRLNEIGEDLPRRLQILDQIEKEREEQFFKEEIGKVHTAHPDWNDHITLVETNDGVEVSEISQALSDWLDDQPDSVAELFASDDPRDCIWVMNQFKRHLSDSSGQAAASVASTTHNNRQNNLARRAAGNLTTHGVSRVTENVDMAAAFDLEMANLN